MPAPGSEPARPSRASVLVEALGSTIEIEVDPSDLVVVREAWSGALADEAGGSTTPTAARRTVVATGQVDLAALSSTVTLEAIESRRGQLLMLHACGVALDDGRVIAFVAPSGTGKTTIARTLGRALAYVSDETVAIDHDGAVLPYRKPLSIIEAPGMPKVQRSPAAAGLIDVPVIPLRIAAVVLLDRDEAHAGPQARIDRLGLLEALPHLVPQLSHLSAMPDGLATIAALADRIGGLQRVRYREAEQVLAVVDELLVPVHDVTVTAVARLVTSAVDAPLGGWARAAGIQALDDGDRIATFADGMLRVLDGIGAALWRALEHPAAASEATSIVVEAIGPPPDGGAEAKVAAAAAELVAAGLLTAR